MATTDEPSDARHASLNNWRTSPFNRWAFHHVRQIISSADIENAADDPWILPAAPLELRDFKLTLPNGAHLNLDGFLRMTSTDAIAIALDGRIVFEAYNHGNTAHSPHILMSATKAVVGLTTALLHERGQINVDALVSDYVPEIAHTAYRGATLRHLLDMRAGVILDETQLRAYATASNWDPFDSEQAAANLHSFFENLTAPHRHHGGPFSYVSANTDLLGWAIERATARSFVSVLSEFLWKPMGAEDGAYITVDRQGVARCTGGLCATARDFLRVGLLLMNQGKRDSSELIPKKVIVDIANGGDRSAWEKGEWGQSLPPSASI
jgi:CubicO group peptidase (beta-lactamase class C family)